MIKQQSITDKPDKLTKELLTQHKQVVRRYTIVSHHFSFYKKMKSITGETGLQEKPRKIPLTHLRYQPSLIRIAHTYRSYISLIRVAHAYSSNVSLKRIVITEQTY